ncbi:MAG TPA: GNAT family N-acetyltransferase [Bacteroidia bacterium]|jgi:ribosomal-protein-alanine N-acetyltransferase|nr:GNAT family N-acetyltransferase [Bacteroidia bacterium]
MKYSLAGLETERLKFRLLEWKDANEWIELFKEKGVVEFLGLSKIPTAEAQNKYWFESNFFKYETNLGGMHVLINKSTGAMIGQAGLFVEQIDGVQELEIGYSILPKYWNKGFATEAVIKCRDHAFEKNYASSLISLVHIDNTQSATVAIRNGMSINKQSVYKEMPVNVFRITREKYEEMRFRKID